MRNFPYPTMHRPLLSTLFLGAIVIGLQLPSAYAAMDLLKLPALESRLASKGMLLAIDVAGDRLVAGGERGLVIYSDDWGANWRQASVPVSVTLTTLHFVSQDVGWAAGHDGVILRTADGGQTWHKQFDGSDANALVLTDLKDRISAAKNTLDAAHGRARADGATALKILQNSLEDAKAGASFGPSRPLLGLWFRDAAEGFAVGSFGQLFHTRNGGTTWESWSGRIQNPEGFHYNAIAQLTDGSLTITGEAGKLRRSIDGGLTWETLDTAYQGHLYGTLAIPNSKILVTYGFAGNIFRSSDSGKTWKPAPKRTNKAIVGGVILADQTILLVASDGRLLISRDRGETYTSSKMASDLPVAAVLPLLIKDNKLAIVGIGGAKVLTVDTTAH